MLCYDCPRNCGIDRALQKGFCGESDKIRVAKIIENFMWEEPCISGDKGALAIFFSGCNLKCDFCQNYKLSHQGCGKEYTADEFRCLLEGYDLSTFSSVDLITPTHFSSLLIKALSDFDCPIPIVWNSSGYEKEEVIQKLADVVDVFLPDFKYSDDSLALKHSKASDYFEVASKAVVAMRKVKKQEIFKDGVLQSGVLIRHLVMPEKVENSKRVLDFLKNEIDNPFISLMSQFTPTQNSQLQRKIYPLEYKLVLSHAEKLGLNHGYIQDYCSSSEDFIPEF